MKIVHTKIGIVHRDITFTNIFRYTDKLILNDWGCATSIDKEVSFSGALKYAPDHILKSIIQHKSMEINYKPKASDDLEAIVKLLYSRMNSMYVTIKQTPENITEHSSILLNFWSNELAPAIWQNLLKLARETNYTQLYIEIKKLIA